MNWHHGKGLCQMQESLLLNMVPSKPLRGSLRQGSQGRSIGAKTPGEVSVKVGKPQEQLQFLH